MQGFIIYTYGNGEGLELLFNGIAAVIGKRGTGDFFSTFVILGFMMGLIWVLLSSLAGQFMRRIAFWALPFYAILTLLFIPSSSVWIKDLATGHVGKVDNVPWGLGAFAGTLSPLSQKLTEKIESVFSLPDDLKYHKTGAMMASNLLAHARTFHITNLDIAETMKDFVNQCVVYDALMGVKFTLDDLKRTPDLWEFMKTHASPARAFTYRDPKSKGRGQILTCKDGIRKLDVLLKGEVEEGFSFFSKKFFLGNQENRGIKAAKNLLKIQLASSFGYMSGLQEMAASAESLMRQNMMIYTVMDAVESKSTSLGNAPNFALRRAYLQQRTAQENMAGVAEKTMLALKNVMEALSYAAFIFILPLIMLPQGWRFLGNWCFLVAWVQMWPPLYALVNFIMCLSARQKSFEILGSTGGALTLGNSVGFADLHADMAAQAGYMSLSVGVFAYALVKGGAASFMSLAGSMASPISAAASRTTEDQLSGNYSFGTLGLGTVQAYNQTFGQEMHSPSYHSGAFSQNDGTISKISTVGGHAYINVANSQLRSTLSWGENLSSTLSEQASSSLTAAQSHSQAFANAEAQGYREAMDFAAHQGASQSYGDSQSTSQQQSDHKAYTDLDQLVNSFAQENKISKESAWQALGRASAGWSLEKSIFGKTATALGLSLGAETSGQYTGTSTDSGLDSKARSFTENASFQKALNDTIQYSQEGRFSHNDEVSKRLSDSMAASFDQSDTYRAETQASLQQAESYTKAAQFAKQNSTALQANLTQEFVEWLPKQSLPHSEGSMGKQASETLLSGHSQGLIPYQQRFLETYGASLKEDLLSHSGGSREKVEGSYDTFQSSLPTSSDSMGDQKALIETKAKAEDMGQAFESAFEDNQNTFETSFNQGRASLQDHMHEKQDAVNKDSSNRKVSNKAQEPLSHSGDSKSLDSSQTTLSGVLLDGPHQKAVIFQEFTGKESPETSPSPMLELDTNKDLSSALKQEVQTAIIRELEDLKETLSKDPDPQALGVKGV